MPFQAKPTPAEVDRFVRWLGANEYVPTTQQQYRSVLRRFHEWLAERDPHAATTADLEDFVLDVYGHLGYASKKNAQVALRTYYGWLQRRGHVPSNPADDLTWPRKRRKRPTFYHPEQVAALLRGFQHPGDELLARVLARHGQRLTPTITLRWGQVDFGNACIRYAPAKGSAITMPLDLDTGKRLRAWKALAKDTAPEGWVFPGRAGRHRNPDAFRDALQAACREAGVPYRGVHELRRTLTTTLLQMGEPLHRVSRQVLGHASVTTTAEHYAGVDDDDVGGAIRRLPY